MDDKNKRDPKSIKDKTKPTENVEEAIKKCIVDNPNMKKAADVLAVTLSHPS